MSHKKIYFQLFIDDQDNTVSCEKYWKSVFLFYLTHILDSKYQISFIPIINESLVEVNSIDFENDLFVTLFVSGKNPISVLQNKNKNLAELFNKNETIVLFKSPDTAIVQLEQPVRFYTLCPLDPETKLPVKDHELFTAEYFYSFLTMVSDLAFEFNLLINYSDEQYSQFIYLAETSQDLSPLRYSLKRELINKGYKILPDKAFPIDESGLRKSIYEDLKKSVLSIHFFGDTNSENYPQLEIQLDKLQNSLAASFFIEQNSELQNEENNLSNYRRIIWLPEKIIIRSEKHQQFVESLRHDYRLYAGSDLIRCSPEELKDIILSKLSGHIGKSEGAPVIQFSDTRLASSDEVLDSYSTVERFINQIPDNEHKIFSQKTVKQNSHF